MTPPPPPTDDESRDRPNFGGRRMEDQLVGWRLGQLELGLTRVEEQLVLLRDDMVTRTSVNAQTAQSRDMVIRVGVWFVGIGQLATTILILVTK